MRTIGVRPLKPATIKSQKTSSSFLLDNSYLILELHCTVQKIIASHGYELGDILPQLLEVMKYYVPPEGSEFRLYIMKQENDFDDGSDFVRDRVRVTGWVASHDAFTSLLFLSL